jgi:tetratricopeptide (TPR) repeat protein
MVLGMVLGFGFNKTKVLAAAEKFVQQGKLQNAITEYEKITKDDPKDLTVLNTIGDLYARIGQVEQAVVYFKRVGDAYATNGFTVKAIAMYKKTTKLSPGSIECIQKLGELYTQQGLYNDARNQLLQVAEFHMKKGQLDDAARLFQKLLELDPENAGMQGRLAELYVKIGKGEEARTIYFRAAESLHQRGDLKKAEEALQRLLALDPANSRALALSGQISIESGDSAKGISFFEKLPDLDSRPDALHHLLKGYLQTNRIGDAEPIARKLFSVHNDLTGIMSCAETLMSTDQAESAIALFEDYADRLLANDPQRLLQALSTATSRVKESVPHLEILRRLYAKAGDETHSTEIAELLAHASVQAGDLAKARDLYKELSDLEPDNPLHLQNYKQILGKLGEESVSRELTQEEGEQAFLVDEIEPVEAVVEQNYSEELSALLQSALTESELFDSYNVPHKAIPPLEAVLSKAPFDLRLNQRLASLYARTGSHDKAARACAMLHSVYSSSGHTSEADQYLDMASKYAQKAGIPVPKVGEVSATEISPAVPPPPPPSVIVDIPETIVPFEVETATVAEAPSGPGSAHEIDLSDEWERMIAGDVVDAIPAAPFIAEPKAEAPAEITDELPAEPTVVEESAPVVDEAADLVQEARFYISQQMWNEAGATIEKLKALAPEHSELAALRSAHEAGAIIAQAQEPAPEIAVEPIVEEFSVEEPAVAGPIFEQELAIEPPTLVEPEPVVAPAPEFSIEVEAAATREIVFEDQPRPTVAEAESEEITIEESVTEAAAEPEIEAAEIGPEAPEVAQPEPEPLVEEATAIEEPAIAAPGKSDDVLGDFVLDLEEALGDDFTIGGAKPAPRPSAPASTPVAMPAAAAEFRAPEFSDPKPVESIPAMAASADTGGAATAAATAPTANGSVTLDFDDETSSALSDLFAEFKEELEEKGHQEDDPDTHYNLGVAFKEMGLLDEAIGELQKVCQSVDRGVPFSQTMQAYTWLAHCFVEKGVPEASFKWYERALKLATDDETRTAIHYELACAYEAANRRPDALNHFMEVYTTNIDFRDVAERIKALKS